MLRLVSAIAIIATIYTYSPVRPTTGLAEQASAWADQARNSVVSAALRPGFARDAAEQTLRQQIGAAVTPAPATEPKPAR